jgi:hypothetical protein
MQIPNIFWLQIQHQNALPDVMLTPKFRYRFHASIYFKLDTMSYNSMIAGKWPSQIVIVPKEYK